MLKTVSTQLALASDTLPEVLAKGNTTGGTDLAVSSGDDITFADSSKAIFGAGSDLQIYSDGSTGQVTGTVNVSGSVGVGDDNAGTNTVAKNFTTPHAAGNQGAIVQYGMGDSTFAGMQIVNAASSVGGFNGQSINFITHEGAVSVGTRLSISSTGDLSVTSGNLSFASGKGIDFSATAGTGTSELLDDYEEGDWTPGYTSWLANPTVATTAKYTKIGRLVNVSVYLTGGTTQAGAQITGLPFTCGTESSMISTNGSNSSLVFYGTVLGGSTVIGSLSAETLTGTYYAVTATYMV